MNTAQREFIDKLYFSLFDLLMSYARSSLGNESLAEEAVQETFHIACMKPENVCSSPKPEGWIIQTLKNVISNMERRRMVANKVITEYLGDKVDALGSSTDLLDLDLLYGNVADTEEFKLVKAIALDGKSMIELAEERGITVSACKKRAQRARELLRRRIK